MVLAKHPEQLRGAMAFLVRRGLDVVTANTMNEAIAVLAKQNANFVLLSVNFPHPKLDMLPTLFQQTFNAETIVFAEVADRKQENKLASIKARHVIFGFASGPSILLRIRQIEKEAQEGSGATKRSAETGADDSRTQNRDENGDIVISSRQGGAGGNDSNVLLKGGAPKSSAEMAAQFMSALSRLENDSNGTSGGRLNANNDGSFTSSSSRSSDDNSDMMQEGSLARAGSGTFVQKGKAPTKFSAMEKGNSSKRGLGVMKSDPRLRNSPYLNQEAAKENEAKARKQAEKDSAEEMKRNLQLARERAQAEKEKKEKEKQVASEKDNSSQAAQSKGSKSKSSTSSESEGSEKSASEKGREAVLHDADQEGLKTKDSGSRPQRDSETGDGKNKGDMPNAFDSEGDDPFGNTDGVPSPDRPDLELSDEAKERERQHADTRNIATRALFMSCARRALMDVTSLTKFHDGAMDSINYVTLLTLRSRSYAGCLMIAIGAIKLDKADVAEALFDRLLYHLVASGANFEKDEITTVTFEHGGFAMKLFGEGEFTISVRDQFWEAGFSYFPLISLEPPIQEASDEHHSAVRVSDIDSHTPVNFEAFIYFPVNSKYVRYLKRGSVFSNNQKSKFSSRGIDNMFIKRESIKDFREHYASSSLKNQVEKMKNKKVKKKAG